jgi:Flp pilus assembly protein TadG
VTTFGRALRAWRARRGERGSTIVEAAIILPVLILLTFGAIEFGIGFRDSAAVASSTRSGARIASALTAQPSFEANAKLSVSDSLKDLLHATPQVLVIYKDDANGNPNGGTVSNGYAGCVDCFRYTWDSANKVWSANVSSDTWTAIEQQTAACANTLPSVGVYVRATQGFITGLFGANKTFDHKTVMRLEPVSSGQC